MTEFKIMKKVFLATTLSIFLTFILIGQEYDSQKYINQSPPGLTPEVFAPGTISTDYEYEFGSAFSITSDTFYYAVRLSKDWKAEIRYTEYHDGKWTNPKRLELDAKYSYNDPYISSDGNRLYFISNRPENGRDDPKDIDLWYVRKTDFGWSEPVNAGEAVNSTTDEFYISISEKETLYYASKIHTTEEDSWDFDIYYSEFKGGKFQTPVRMSDSINSRSFECDAYIAPDESYIIFCSTRQGGYGEGDLYISFKNNDNSWSKAINMGEVINTDNHEFCPFVTRDGKYFFYSGSEDIYWVDAKVIEKLKR